MKQFLRVCLLLVILCSAAISVHYAASLYREKYAPRYLNGNAC